MNLKYSGSGENLKLSLYSFIAARTKSQVCIDYIYNNGDVDLSATDSCTLYYNLAQNPCFIGESYATLTKALRGYLSQRNYEILEPKHGRGMVGNYIPRSWEMVRESVLASSGPMNSGNWLSLEYSANAQLLILDRCPKVLDRLGVEGWDLFFEMVDNWQGDLEELPEVVASILSKNLVS